MSTEVNRQQGENDPFNVQYWSTRWTQNKIGFHKTSIASTLLNYIELVTGQKLTTEPLRDLVQFQNNHKFTWFVPLCGKTVDIPYLLSQGFRVFGVEAVKKAIEELENEQSLGLVLDENTSLYTGADGRLTIYMGDLFKCPVEEYGPFDFVWDRASFIAVEYPHRQPYSEVMQRALKGHNFRYLMETISYDMEKFTGPPNNVSDSDLDIYYRSWANVKFLSEERPPVNSVIFKELDGQVLLRKFLITPKA